MIITSSYFNQVLKFVIALLLTFSINPLKASELSEALKGSAKTYIFKISNSEAEHLYKTNGRKIDTTFFHTLHDSHPVDSFYYGSLPNGHYIKAEIKKNKVYFSISTIADFSVNVISNNRDLCVRVTDKKGEIVNDAEVQINWKKLKFDHNSLSYVDKRSNKKGLLKVTYKGQYFYYKLIRDRNHNGFDLTTRAIIYRSPLQIVWAPLKYIVNLPIDGVKSISYGHPWGTIHRTTHFFEKLFKKTLCIFDSYYCKDNYNKDGYFITNKPKYRSGDTVKLKAYVIFKKRLYNKPLDIELKSSGYYNSDYKYEKTITTIKPYAPGAYEFSFCLHDSLNLQLDRGYDLQLTNKKDGYLDSEDFMFEDYVLSKLYFDFNTNSEKHYRSIDFEIKTEGKDINKLNLKDAQVRIFGLIPNVSETFTNQCIVPDTLFQFTEKLKTDGPTIITLKDSLFPKANLRYKLTGILQTSDKERTSKTIDLEYFYKHNEIEYKITNDSIEFCFKQNGIKIESEAMLYYFDGFENCNFIGEVKLPHKEKINPYIDSYLIENKDISKKISMYYTDDMVNVNARRTLDSISINISNPRKLHCNYFLYKRSKEVKRGYGQDINFKINADNKQTYTLTVHYTWAGRSYDKNYSIALETKSLKIDVNQEPIIYPGQKTSIELKVTDYKNKPVENVDITALGLTKKFNYTAPNLNNYNNTESKLRGINSFRLDDIEFNERNTGLEFTFWDKLENLNENEYYKFIYPGNEIYTYETKLKDKTTQFAPFIISKGAVFPVNIIYVDNKPIYFNWNSLEEPYSFIINSGYHNIKIRTPFHQITIDSIFFKKHKKTIFSLDIESKNPKVKIESRKAKLSKKEQDVIYKYIFPFDQSAIADHAYLKQNDRVFSLDKRNRTFWYNRTYFTGPISPGELRYTDYERPSFLFEHEAFYKYTIKDSFIKMKEISPSAYPKTLYFKEIEQLNDYAISSSSIYDEWKSSKKIKDIEYYYFTYPEDKAIENGDLFIELNENKKNPDYKPNYIILLEKNIPQLKRIYLMSTIIKDIPIGSYDIIFLYQDKKIRTLNELSIKANCSTHLKYDNKPITDTTLYKHYAKMVINGIDKIKAVNLQKLDKKFKKELSNKSLGLGGEMFIYGKITAADDGLPIPGVTIMVPGTSTGTTSDFNGEYALYVPEDTEILRYSFVGMERQDVVLPVYGPVNVQMAVSAEVLSEVVVTAMGISRSKKSLGYSVGSYDLENEYDITQTLRGRVAGVNIINSSGVVGAGSSITIRGAASIGSGNSPLYIIDGVPYLGDPNSPLDIDPNDIGSVSVLKGLAAANLYGESGSNGVIIITTKSGNASSQLINEKKNKFKEIELNQGTNAYSIRSNFSDYAFWEPKLRTNKDGKVKFDVTFPDDITSWDSHYLAMKDNKMSGKAYMITQSYKPLMAQLSLPRFICVGDSISVIGKSLNYLPDSCKIQSVYEVNDKLIFKKDVIIKELHLDSLKLNPLSGDSLKAKYFIKKEDGYFDGEIRNIPILPKGIEKKKGSFYVLENDTSLLIKPDVELGTITLNAHTNLLNVYEKSLEKIIDYEHNCNEQMSSKLMAIIHLNTIRKLRDAEEIYQKRAKRIVRKLIFNQNKEGLWGWWGKSNTSIWVSAHVYKALKLANQNGYDSEFDIEKNLELIMLKLESSLSKLDRLRLMKILINEKILFDHQASIKKLEKDSLSTLEKFELMECKQLLGIDIKLGELNNYQQETILGNIFYQDEFDRQEIEMSLAAYRLIRNEDSTSNQLAKIRNYLLEKRRNESWLNTYQSINMIETILSDLLPSKNSTYKSPKLKITGAIDSTISEFPINLAINNKNNISVEKTGLTPIYLSYYQTDWTTTASTDHSNFVISSTFGNKSRTSINCGNEIDLVVKLEVKKNAEYIVINIPIPAGCSYVDKPNNFKNEVHREYHKEKTVIYCEKLKTGTYNFSIKLLPKFTGKVLLNPASVELMYHPSINANNTARHIHIKD